MWSKQASLCVFSFILSSQLFCFSFQAHTVSMSFLFDWIYRGVSNILQFLGEYCLLFWNDLDVAEKYHHPKLSALCRMIDILTVFNAIWGSGDARPK